MSDWQDRLAAFLDAPQNVVGAALLGMALVAGWLYFARLVLYVKLIAKSLLRNSLRSVLTGLATAVLVFVITLVWTVLYFLDLVTAEKSKDLKAIVTERWQIPSQMPLAYESGLARGGARKPGDVVPEDAMTWQFYGGTIDPAKRTRENIVFFFGMQPGKLLTVPRDAAGNPLRDDQGRIRYTTMMDGIDEMTEQEVLQLDAACRAMEVNKRQVIVGQERLAALNKKVGEWMTVTSFNYPGVDLEVEIIGAFPKGRYDQSALVNRDYINDALDAYKRKNGVAHPMADKTLNLVWLRVPDTEAFRQVAEQITNSPEFLTPAVKCETASSGIASFLDAYRDLLWGMRWLLVPAILVTMSLVIANAISISVRERRGEMAVLKVLGFGPNQVLILVLGEALLIGCGSGLLSTSGAFLLINKLLGGVPFPVGFFPAFKIPEAALWWGPVLGGLTAFAGSILPAWSARSVKVAEVFSKIS
jgi:putative ABC transport system permease protein